MQDDHTQRLLTLAMCVACECTRDYFGHTFQELGWSLFHPLRPHVVIHSKVL